VPRSRLLAGALVGLAALTGGCGEDNEDAAGNSGKSSSPPATTYSELLTGLKRAAAADAGYRAARRARALPAAERVVVDAFCEITLKLEVNDELEALTDPDALPFMPRVRNFAITKLLANPDVEAEDRRAMSRALQRLAAFLDLHSLDVESNNRFKRACYT